MANHDLESLSDDVLTEKLYELSKRDLELTSEIVVHIHEFMTRRLYLDHGCTSLFAYLTDKLGYSRATAQNRFDAARLLDVDPEIANDLARVKINLSQITLMSMGIRQVEKQTGNKVSAEQKLGIIKKLKTAKMSEHHSAQLVAQELDIKINPAEKVRVHHDGSVTIEMHLSKEEFENLKRVRDLNSHKKCGAKLGETVAEAAKFFLEKKDPLKLKTKIVAHEPSANLAIGSNSNLDRRSGFDQNVSSDPNLKSKSPGFPVRRPEPTPRAYIGVDIVRAIHQRDKSCRQMDGETGEVCGSTYLLQIDHIKGLVDGGGNNIENLQLKCAVHNRRKFELERRNLQTELFN